ncbi:MAG: universal stress protein [Bacteroidia bacterium]|nr:universal stress protein [Bacteroidia bacterium]
MEPLKLVLLTDFSPLSKVAIQYAMKMASKLEVEFTIINVVRLDGVPKSNLKWKQIERSLLMVAEEEGEKLVNELKAKTNAPIVFKAIRAHTVADMVTRYVEKNYTNLVIMGSQGASQLKKTMLGGTTVAVIDSVHAPVLAIPRLAEFKSFKRVVYSSDLKDPKKELEILIPFAQIFDSRIHMVHVVPAIDMQVEEQRKSVEALIQNSSYSKIDFKLLINDDVPGAIDNYIKEVKADLLTTFTHELNLFEKLFRLSVTRKLAYRGSIPLLAFKRK